MTKHRLLIFAFLLLLPPHLVFAGPLPEPEVVLLAGGDLLFTSHLNPYIAKQGYDYPFLGLRSLLEKADIVFANLETPLTSGGEPFPAKGYTFRAPPLWAKALARNGFNLLSLANNHIMDYGAQGLADTLRLLRREGIQFSGAGENVKQARRAAWLEINGLKIACLSYSLTFPQEFYAQENQPGTAFAYAQFLEEDIPATRSLSDVLIVSFHWSEELRRIPKDYQRKLAHKVIDLGADIVLGHHPHVLQGLEVYRGKVIAYSLGNLAFASYSRRVKTSMLLRCRLGRGHTIREVEIIPLSVNNHQIHFQPQPLSGAAARSLLCDLDVLSQPLGAEIILEGDLGRLLLNP